MLLGRGTPSNLNAQTRESSGFCCHVRGGWILRQSHIHIHRLSTDIGIVGYNYKHHYHSQGKYGNSPYTYPTYLDTGPHILALMSHNK